MHPMVKHANELVCTPEIQEIMRRLAEYGLGVCMPHMHESGQDDFAPLLSGTVQVERNLKITFETDTTELRETSSPVAWRWNHGTQTVQACTYCMDTQKGHARFPD